MSSFTERYTTTVIPHLQKELGVVNVHAMPRVMKVVVAVGVGKNMRDPKDIAIVRNTLERITGQKPVETKAKKSISGFKVREGMVVGLLVTLRGRRMTDFLEKLIRVTLPRVRDFRGLDPAAVDREGNCTLGIREHIAFPEIRSDEIEKIHGLAITMKTNAGDAQRGLVLFRALGFPFQKTAEKREKKAKVRFVKKEKPLN